uniref:Uncharacterized protein n=1 Tax=Rhizoctonia solani TaxID=456999 RepID=N0A6Y0_9AGAM|nr:hypothetical protein RSOL_m00650 [Rhizoctonia solani]AGK45394.1 hypothetical protein RSOL_m00650 [Rhizoctonia solani]
MEDHCKLEDSFLHLPMEEASIVNTGCKPPAENHEQSWFSTPPSAFLFCPAKWKSWLCLSIVRLRDWIP